MILNVADDAPVADAVFPVTRLLDQLLFRFIKLQDAVGERLVPATRIPWVLACRRCGGGAPPPRGGGKKGGGPPPPPGSAR